MQIQLKKGIMGKVLAIRRSDMRFMGLRCGNRNGPSPLSQSIHSKMLYLLINGIPFCLKSQIYAMFKMEKALKVMLIQLVNLPSRQINPHNSDSLNRHLKVGYSCSAFLTPIILAKEK